MWNKLAMTRIALAAGLTAASVASFAGELVLYEYPGFVGRSLTMRAAAANFGEIGFNDRAESLVVISGNWQVCTDANYGGLCATLVPGEYRQLDPRFAGRLSSAREIGAQGQPILNPAPSASASSGAGLIEFFEGLNFTGPSIRLDRDSFNFANSGFNDRASSVIVHAGTWDICNDPDYRGSCRNLPPGRYADLGYSMSRNVSSARVTSAGTGTTTSPYVIGGYDGGPPVQTGTSSPAAPAALKGRVVLYDAEGFVGRNIAFIENMVDLQSTGFNDQSLSAVVESGHWEVCSDSQFRGNCQVLEPGLHRRLDPVVARNVSSARLVVGSSRGRGGRGLVGVGGAAGASSPTTASQPVSPPVLIEFFEHDGFSGRKFSVTADESDFGPRGFNDTASSLVIHVGQWQVCTDARYSGQCVVFGPGQYASLGGLNDKISSTRRVGQ